MARSVVAWAAVLIGLGTAIAGVRIRLGIARRWVRNYLSPELPFYWRNAPFGWIPGGLGIFLIGLAILEDPDEISPLGGVAVVAGFVLVGAYFWITWRVPLWSMPAWLQAQQPGRTESTQQRDSGSS